MHTDENKKYDKRVIEILHRRGVVIPKDYEAYLSRLPDVSSKIYNPEEEGMEEGQTSDARIDPEDESKKKGTKKRGKG